MQKSVGFPVMDVLCSLPSVGHSCCAAETFTHSATCAEDGRFHGTGAVVGSCRFRGGGLGKRAAPLLSGWE